MTMSNQLRICHMNGLLVLEVSGMVFAIVGDALVVSSITGGSMVRGESMEEPLRQIRISEDE